MAIFSIPLNVYTSQTLTIPSRATPQGMEGCLIEMPRCTTADPTIWPLASTIIVFSLDFSYDNEATWSVGQYVARHTGGIRSKNGVEVAVSQGSMYFSPPPTHVRGSVELIGGPSKVGVTFTTL